MGACPVMCSSETTCPPSIHAFNRLRSRCGMRMTTLARSSGSRSGAVVTTSPAIAQPKAEGRSGRALPLHARRSCGSGARHRAATNADIANRTRRVATLPVQATGRLVGDVGAPAAPTSATQPADDATAASPGRWEATRGLAMTAQGGPYEHSRPCDNRTRESRIRTYVYRAQAPSPAKHASSCAAVVMSSIS